ncbi:MAG: protoglobin domain-containing protein [Xenococcaceae cyanobacterium MO_207.B15]|nr:protoglobin domain-containing protein [Xenococcaceae cyanobacterium MO_207.B15]MDJ0747126.1 protoglobin domain-containing protein [Xenococcaceae cyanobacterium MO_167.B27]
MGLAPEEFMEKMEQRMLFSDEDKSLLQSKADWGKEIAPEMAEYFYDYLEKDSEMKAILHTTEERIHRLRATFIDWFYEMFTGMDNWGDEYAQRRWRIGLIHVRLGIGPQHVVPAMATVVREAQKKIKSQGKKESLGEALSKICMIDLAFIEQAYLEVSSNAVLRETGWTEGLFRRLIATGAEAM